MGTAMAIKILDEQGALLLVAPLLMTVIIVIFWRDNSKDPGGRVFPSAGR